MIDLLFDVQSSTMSAIFMTSLFMFVIWLWILLTPCLGKSKWARDYHSMTSGHLFCFIMARRNNTFDMMMMSALYSRLSWIFIVLAHWINISLHCEIPQIDISPLWDPTDWHLSTVRSHRLKYLSTVRSHRLTYLSTLRSHRLTYLSTVRSHRLTYLSTVRSHRLTYLSTVRSNQSWFLLLNAGYTRF